jgi:hypothetical protein
LRLSALTKAAGTTGIVTPNALKAARIAAACADSVLPILAPAVIKAGVFSIVISVVWAIAEDLEMPYETVKISAKLARAAIKLF